MSDNTSNAMTAVRQHFSELVALCAEEESLKESKKAIIATLKADHQIDPKLTRAVVRLLVKKNKPEVDGLQQDIDRLYEAVA